MDFFEKLIGRITPGNWQRNYERATLDLAPIDMGKVGEDTGKRVVLEHHPRHYRESGALTLTVFQGQAYVVQESIPCSRRQKGGPYYEPVLKASWRHVYVGGNCLQWESFDVERSQAHMLRRLWAEACRNRANADAEAALLFL